MKFSIITPVYNGDKFIPEAIESTINQNHTDWEMLIINNGSTDNTVNTVSKYVEKDRRIILINCNYNSGSPARPRNLGLKEAQGKYVAFLDADDVFLPGKLAAVEQYFTDHPDIDCVCHGEKHIKNNTVIRKDYYGPHTTYEDLFFRGNSLSTSAIVMKRSCIEKVGFFSEEKEFSGFEDYDYWLRLAKTCRIGYLRKILGTYTVNERSEASKISANCENAINFLDLQYSTWGKKTLYYKLLMRKRKALCLRASAREFIRIKDYKSSIPLLSKAIAYNPLSLKQWVFFALALVGDKK